MKTCVLSHKDVLLIHVTTAPQSLYHFFRGQIGFMREHGFRVEAISSPGPMLERFAEREGIPVHAVEMSRAVTPLRDLLALFRLWRLFRTLRPHIVHAHTPKASLLTMVAAALAGVRVRIYHVHGFPSMTASGFMRQVLTLTERTCCRLAHRVLFVSPSIRNVALEKGICSPQKSRVLHNGSINGVDAQEQFNPQAITMGQVRAEVGIPPNALVIGFVGRVVRDKGVIELMQAWQSLRKRFDNLYLLVVGPMEMKDRIPAEVKMLILSDPRIRYIGEVLDPVNYYAAMDVLALPSHREGFGLVAIEAAAMNLPVVATRIVGCVDSVVDGDTGTLVPPGNEDELERALVVYLENIELRKLHGSNGRSMVMERFCPQSVWEALYAEYRQLLQSVSNSYQSAGGDDEARATRFLYVTRVPITAARFILPLANKLRERGNHVEFAFGPGEGLQEMKDSGFPFTVLKMDKKSRSAKNAGVVRELRQVIKNGRYDVVHTYSPIIGVYGRLAAYKTNTPVVVHSVIGSLLAAGVPAAHRVMYIASELATSRMVDLFITLNDADAHDMVKYRLAHADKVVSLKYEYGVDLREFKPESIDEDHLDVIRKQHGLENGIPVIGFIGRMIGAKGILDLFEAYRQIRNNGVMAKLVYLGDVLSTDKDQASISRLMGLVKKLGFEADVVFLGFQKDVPFYISMMDVVVLPSHHEGFPRIPVEAGAMGKPSVTTATAGAEVAIDEGNTGFIVPIKDPDRLGEALQKIITDPALAQTMGTNARQRVIDLFDQNKIVDQQVQIYADFFKKHEKTKGYQV